MALESIKLRITGKTPLLMNNIRALNKRDPEVRALLEQKEAITRKGTRNRTDEEQEQLDYIDWQLALYHKPDVGPYLPSNMILGCLRDGAKQTRQGKTLVRTAWLDEAIIPLDYEGPRSVEALYADGRFFDYRAVVVQRARVMRARPVFPTWGAEFTIVYDAGIIDGDDVVRIAETAGRYMGLGDFRPTFGRFEAAVVNSRKD